MAHNLRYEQRGRGGERQEQQTKHAANYPKAGNNIS